MMMDMSMLKDEYIHDDWWGGEEGDEPIPDLAPSAEMGKEPQNPDISIDQRERESELQVLEPRSRKCISCWSKEEM